MSAIYCSLGCGRFWLHSPAELCDPCWRAARAELARAQARAADRKRRRRAARVERARRPKPTPLPRPSSGIPRTAYLPLEPLLALIDGDPARLARCAGVSYRTVSRWVRDGAVSAVRADAIAVACGYHPAEVWGMRWLTLAA